MNHALTVCVVLLLAIGVVAVYSAASIRDDAVLRTQYLRHAEVAVAGLAFYFLLACVDSKIFLRFSWLFYGASLGLLGMVLVMGTVIMGARRWLFGIQPAEIAKLALIMVLAQFLGSTPRREQSGAGLYFGALALTIPPVVLILMQPDLGTALVFCVLAMTLLYVRGCAPKLFWWHTGLAALFTAYIVGMLLLSEHKGLSPEHAKLAQRASLLTGYQRERVLTFIFPERDRFNAGWTRWQSEIAVGSGGVWGKGLKKGDRNVLGYLPASVTSNDFIFSVIAEEAGFAGATTVVVLQTALVLILLGIAFACPEPAGRLYCAGVASVIFWHAFENIAMTVGLMPVTGLPLPFISYGRTFVLMLLLALGVVQSFTACRPARE